MPNKKQTNVLTDEVTDDPLAVLAAVSEIQVRMY